MSKEELIELLVEDIGDNGLPKTLKLQKNMEEKIGKSKPIVGNYLKEIFNEQNISLPEGENRYGHLPYTEFIKKKVQQRNTNPQYKNKKTLEAIENASETGTKLALDKVLGPRLELREKVKE